MHLFRGPRWRFCFKEDSTEMKKVFHLGSLLKIHWDRNILELTISPTGSGQLFSEDRIQSPLNRRRDAMSHAHASRNVVRNKKKIRYWYLEYMYESEYRIIGCARTRALQCKKEKLRWNSGVAIRFRSMRNSSITRFFDSLFPSIAYARA